MSQTVRSSMNEITDSLVNLLDDALTNGIDMLVALSKAGAGLSSQFAPLQKSLKLPNMGGCCEIPPPCWMPRELRSVLSHVCPGATATLRFCITNCGMSPRTFTVETDHQANISPAKLELGPFQRGCVTVSFAAPSTSCLNDRTDLLVFAHGCKSYYLRWTVQTTNRGCDCCHEVDVNDCPDLVHHWYDHFYCPRPCPPHTQVFGK